MKTTPNQRIITVYKGVCDADNLYTSINLEVLGQAVKKLKKEGSIKLFLYLSKNQPKYTFALSSKHFCEWANVSKPTYNEAVEELVKNNYLQFVREDKKTKLFYYNFYETANTDVKIQIVQQPSVVIKPKFDF